MDDTASEIQQILASMIQQISAYMLRMQHHKVWNYIMTSLTR